MNSIRWILVVTSTALLMSAPAMELNENTFEQWRDRILPTNEETGYAQIAWRTSFWDAVIEAQELEKPILLWTMNGHPLGCT